MRVARNRGYTKWREWPNEAMLYATSGSFTESIFPHLGGMDAGFNGVIIVNAFPFIGISSREFLQNILTYLSFSYLLKSNCVLRLVILALPLFLSACSGLKIKSDDGTVHHLILGIGVVSVPASDNTKQLEAIRSHALGLSLQTGIETRLSLGYTFNTTLIIPDNIDNVCAEISQAPFGPIKLESCKNLQRMENQ